MFDVCKVIEDKRVERGMAIAELSRRAGIPYQNLWASLRGTRSIPAAEFVELCKVLELDVADFPVTESDK